MEPEILSRADHQRRRQLPERLVDRRREPHDAPAGIQPRDLTARELEIATMAARGLSSKTIAERLIVSVRTVDNTLHQVYGKLAVNNRADLRPLLAETEFLSDHTQTPS